jgi:uncharacterized protein (DUF2249 family)
MAELAEPVQRIDVRQVPPPQRHPMIFSVFDGLAPGAALELVNDHDPVPLYFQFDRQRSGQFRWDYLDAGPDLWRVRITQVGGARADGEAAQVGSSCCGSCSCR